MTPIQTGWQPEGALGAMYHGMNAANADDENALNLAKLFMANQREQQMMPLDIEAKKLSLDPAKYESVLSQAKINNRDYIPGVMSGYLGQMKSQQAAGDTAMALQPFKQKAEQSQLENENTRQGFQWTLNDLTNKITQGGDIDENGNVVKASPSQMAFFKQKRDELTNLLAQTPEYAQKDMLKDQQYAANLAAVEARSQAAIEAARQRAEAAADAKVAREPRSAEEFLVADLKQRVANREITPDQARKELADYFAGKQKVNPNAGMVLSIDDDGNITYAPGQTINTWKPSSAPQPQRTIVRTGKDSYGNRVVQYSDGTIERAK